MPIQFPRPTGSYRAYIDRQIGTATKRFDVVPAPSFGNIGPPLGSYRLGDDTSVATTVQKATNVRRFSTMYEAPENTAKVNPAAFLVTLFDSTGSYKRVLGAQNEKIVGVSRDAVGAPLGTCVIKVFRTADDILVGSTVSDGSGNWTFYPIQPGPYYYVEYKAGAPDVFGTSPNTNTSTQFTPGQ